MRFVTENIEGNVHSSIFYINAVGRAPFLHQLIHVSASRCIAIYKVYQFKQYQKFWDELHYDPDGMCTEEEFTQQKYPS